MLIVATGFGQEVYLVRSRGNKRHCRATAEQPLLTGKRFIAFCFAADVQVDRKNDVYQVYWLTFPHQDGEEFNHSNTVLDGEFVIDVDPVTGAVSFQLPSTVLGFSLVRECSLLGDPCARNSQHIPRLLVFDLLVLDSETVMHRPLEKRYGVRLSLPFTRAHSD